MKQTWNAWTIAVGLLALTACASPVANTTSQPASTSRAITSGFSGDVTLKALANGKYVSAENAGANPLIANRDTPQGWETFTLVPLGGDNYGLKAQANGKFVCADNAGTSPLIANRDTAQGWETFTLVSLGGDNYGLKALANGKFVCADNAGTSPLIANRDSAQGWETFTITPVNNSNPTWTWPAASGALLNGYQATSPLATNLSTPWASFPFGADSMVSNNAWGIPSNGDGNLNIFRETVNGADTFGWSWNTWNATNVTVYPEIGWGYSPNANAWWTHPVTIPKISDNKQITANFNIRTQAQSGGAKTGSGGWDLAFDIWITPDSQPASVQKGYELMIWLDHEYQGAWGGYKASKTFGGDNYNIYANDWAAGWDVLSYIVQRPAYQGIHDAQGFNITQFINDAAQRFGIPGSFSVAAIEFGNESIGGKGMTEVANWQLNFQ